METNSTNNISPMSDERIRMAEANNDRRRELKKNAEAGLTALSESPQARKGVLDLIGQGGSLGRRVEREIRRYESTGRISNWLTNSVTQGELKNVAARTLTKQTPPPASVSFATLDLAPQEQINLPIKFEIPTEAGATERRLPWDIYVSETNGSGNYTLKVEPALISNILATNWDNEWQASSGNLVYGIATISTDGRNITSISLNMTTSAPARQQPQKFGVQGSVAYLFGLFYNGSSYNLLRSSVFVYPRLRLVTTADPAAAAGQSPFDLWYELGT